MHVQVLILDFNFNIGRFKLILPRSCAKSKMLSPAVDSTPGLQFTKQIERFTVYMIRRSASKRSRTDNVL